MNNAVIIQNLSKRFGNVPVLNHINVCLEAGRIHGIVGRNGSGKTVLMKCILGFLRPTEGSVSVFGRQIGQDCDFAPDTGMIIETPGFLLDESGRSNLDWLLRLSGRSAFPSALPKPSTPLKRFPLSDMPNQIVSPSDPAEALAMPAHTERHSRREAVSAAMRLVGLDPDSRKPVGHYSLGMRQRLGIAQALLEQPRLLVLDEPMNGLDNQGVSEMRQLFLSLRENGVTILMASHNPLDITSLCDKVYEMDGGYLSGSATPASLT